MQKHNEISIQFRNYVGNSISSIFIHGIRILLPCIVLCGCLYKKPSDSYWHDTTLNDLKCIQNILIAHSAPGANLKDHHFQYWLKEVFLKTSKYVSKVKSKSDYISVLKFYINGFVIDHLSIDFLVCEKTKYKMQVFPFRERSLIGFEFINKGVWIYLPTFNPNYEQKKE